MLLSYPRLNAKMPHHPIHTVYDWLDAIQFDAFKKYEWKLFSSKNFGNLENTKQPKTTATTKKHTVHEMRMRCLPLWPIHKRQAREKNDITKHRFKIRK